jgi:hypothetical protein
VSETTLIQADKLRAYLATDYRVHYNGQALVLKVGVRSDRLAGLLAARGTYCGAFLTAYNPRGTRQSDSANELAHARLRERLLQLGLDALEGGGSEAGSDWQPERSWFAAGLGLYEAKSVGLEFDQDAIVWTGSDAIPRLILLR